MAKLFLKGIDGNAQRAVNFADPSSAQDLVTKAYADALVRGLDWKASVRAATTTNGTLATAYANGSVIDGVTLATGDRILLKDQSTGSENGIYTVNASGAPTRATDADNSPAGEVTAGMATTVTEGTANGDKVFILTTNDPITLGTTALAFSALGGGAGSAYATVQAAGSGLTQRTILNFGAGLTATDNAGSSRTDVVLDTAVAVRKFSADCVATTNPQAFTHSLGTKDVMVQVRRLSDDVLVEADITATSTTQVTVDFGGAPTAAQYRVTVFA